MKNTKKSISATVVGFFVGLFALTSQAETSTETTKEEPLTVIAVVTLKRGQTCMGVTKAAGFPLSYEGCQALAENSTLPKKAFVDRRNPMMQVVYEEYMFPEGYMFAYVETPKGRTWVLVDPD